jgi:hypothetical protein
MPFFVGVKQINFKSRVFCKNSANKGRLSGAARAEHKKAI